MPVLTGINVTRAGEVAKVLQDVISVAGVIGSAAAGQQNVGPA